MMGVAKASLRRPSAIWQPIWARNKIRVNAISAGPIKTTSARGIKDFSKVLEGVAAIAPLRRNTDPAEVADTAVFLASDLAGRYWKHSICGLWIPNRGPWNG